MNEPELAFYMSEGDPPAKREILRAAMELFSERGVAGTSIRDIAARSGYTNPALYKHFAGKQELALHLFESCHRRVFSRCSVAVGAANGFEAKLEAYVGAWLELIDEHPDVVAFLSDSSRVLWPKASRAVRRNTMIGLARAVVLAASSRRGTNAANPDLAAGVLQGTMGELARMLQVGVVEGPAVKWRDELVTSLRKVVA